MAKIKTIPRIDVNVVVADVVASHRLFESQAYQLSQLNLELLQETSRLTYSYTPILTYTSQT